MLISPPPTQYLERYDTPDFGHLGIACLAGSLERAGYVPGRDLDVVDSRLMRLRMHEVEQRVEEFRPHVVGLTAYTHEVFQAGELASRIKARIPGVVTVVGGVHASAIPAETLERIPGFDAALIGEGEEAFVEVLEHVAAGERSFPDIPGLMWRENGTIRGDCTIRRVATMDTLPFSAWHLLPRTPEYQIMTARGCPRACVFCMSPYGRHRIREMSPERVLEEMEWVIDGFHPTTYKFNDESFGFNGDRMHAILDGMLSRGFGEKTRFLASMRADRVTGGLLRKMKEANFYAVEVGVETGDETILRNIKKGESLEETERAVQLIKEHGFQVLCGFIIGHPGDTRETVLRTIDFAAKLNPDVAAFGLMVPYPGTEIAEYAATGRYGYRLLSNDWSTYNKQYGNALELEDLPRPVMERLQTYAYLKVFLANRRFGDVARFLWTYRKAGWNLVKKQLRRLGGNRHQTTELERAEFAVGDTGADFRRRNYRG